jgi:hypothetical protein
VSTINDLIDEQTGLATARLPWEKYWRAIAMYVLPQVQMDQLMGSNWSAAVNSVVNTPVAAEKSKDLYDMTSLWGIERLSAGMLSLKTPESEMWQDLGLNSFFGKEPTHEEKAYLESLRDYMFKVRHNPASGFWPAHRAAVKSMCAFGDGWMFTEEQNGVRNAPYRFEYMPLPQLYPAVGPDGQPNRMIRVIRMSAIQIVTKWGADAVGSKVVEYANDPKKKHDSFNVMHSVRPREDKARNALGVRGAKFASYYCLPDEKHIIGESGYFEFPFSRLSWGNSGLSPFSEGPVAYALGEIKSLQEMAKNELLAAQMVLRPPLGLVGKNMVRLNFNAGAVNPGLVNPDGRPMFAPLNAGVRPDFAQAILESRRTNAREMLYLNLWQIILNDTQDTATAALIKAQEKGELLGPVGISMNEGLSHMNDREIGILGRKGAFEKGSPLEMPATLVDADVSAVFTSPLDRLRRMSQLVGMQRLVEFGMTLEGLKPGTAARFDADEMLDIAQDILGAPVKALRPAQEAQEARAGNDQMAQLLASMEAMRAGGEAAGALGSGGAALAQGAEAAKASPALQKLLSPDTIGRVGGAMGAMTGQAA